MNIQRISFPINEFCREEFAKRQIVLHHTVSSSAKSAENWWRNDKGKQRVASAFIVEKDGTIFQLFDPKFWAYHIGTGSTIWQNRRSIAIEIVNEGGLIKEQRQGQDIFLWNDRRNEYKGEVVTLPEPWRGYHCFAAYTKEQYSAVMELLNLLCERFAIPDVLIASYKFSETYRTFHGIVSHHNLRPDKSDVSIAFDYRQLRMTLRNQ